MATVHEYVNRAVTTTRCTVTDALGKSQCGGLRLIFLPREALLERTVQTTLAESYKFPRWLSQSCWYNANGFAGGDRRTLSEGGIQQEVALLWYRFLVKQVWLVQSAARLEYQWFHMTFLSTTNSYKETTIFCLDVPKSLRHRITVSLMSVFDATPEQPLVSPDSIIIEQILYYYDEATWKLRDLIREVEKHRRQNFGQLHELARHALHTTETLEVATDTTADLITTISSHERSKRAVHSILGHSHADTLKIWLAMLRNISRRAGGLTARLSNEIGLAYNLTAQADNQANLRIAAAAQQDAAAMKLISSVTLVFLPATFVSTLFSMSFFNYTPDPVGSRPQWTVSNMFWVYWAIVVPVTISTIALWMYGQRSPKNPN